MRYYLSSYRFCNNAKVYSLLFRENKKVFVIRNALDYSSDQARLESGLQREMMSLRELGLIPTPLDLREYFGKETELSKLLEDCGGLWVVGGNCFILRKAMKASGLDNILCGKLHDSDFVYGGYSAGVCVLGPTLDGIHLADEPEIEVSGYDAEIVWLGLGLLNYSVAPHYQSDHPESPAINDVVKYFIEKKILFKCLRDGESIVI